MKEPIGIGIKRDGLTLKTTTITITKPYNKLLLRNNNNHKIIIIIKIIIMMCKGSRVKIITVVIRR